MGLWLKQSAAVTLKVGPFLDSTDGVTAETALTILQANVLLSKNGAAFTQKTASGGGAHDANGWYAVSLEATDTGTLGRLQLSVQVSGACPVWHEFLVMPPMVYDSLVAGSDVLSVRARGFVIDAYAVSCFAIENAEAWVHGRVNNLQGGKSLCTSPGSVVMKKWDPNLGDWVVLVTFDAVESDYGLWAKVNVNEYDDDIRPGDLYRLYWDGISYTDGSNAWEPGQLVFNLYAIDANAPEVTIAGLTATGETAVEKAVTDGIDTALPGSPTANSLGQRVKALDELTEASGEGDLAAVRAKTDLLPTSPAATGDPMTLADGAITAAKIATGAVDADALASDATAEIAGAVANRDLASHESAAKNGTRLGDMLAAARAGALGRLELSGTTLTLYEVDGSTVLARFTVAEDYSRRSAPE